jgi:hypothetical protein
MSDEFFLTAAANAIRWLAKNVVGDVVEIGRLLTEAKERCAHGDWLPWLQKEFSWHERTAQNFMRVHQLSKNENFSDLAVALDLSSLYLLARPSTPESVRDAAAARVRAGETPTLGEIRDAVRPPLISRVAVTAGESRPLLSRAPVFARVESGLDIAASIKADTDAMNIDRAISWLLQFGQFARTADADGVRAYLNALVEATGGL